MGKFMVMVMDMVSVKVRIMECFAMKMMKIPIIYTGGLNSDSDSWSFSASSSSSWSSSWTGARTWSNSWIRSWICSESWSER